MRNVNRRGLYLIAILAFIASALGPIANVQAGLMPGGWPPPVYMSLSLVGTTLIVFFGFLIQGLGKDNEIDGGDLRSAIAVTIVVVYFVLIGWTAFMDARVEAPPMGTQLLKSFTAIVAIVIPSFFGVSAYERVKNKEIERGQQKVDETGERREPLV